MAKTIKLADSQHPINTYLYNVTPPQVTLPGSINLQGTPERVLSSKFPQQAPLPPKEGINNATSGL